MPDPSVAIQREIEIDGSKLPDNVLIHLESATVIDRLTMPDTFTLVFRDPDRNILSTAGIQVGDQGRDLDHLDARGRPEGSHRRRGHLDRDGVRGARHAGRGPRLRPIAPPCGGPQVEDVPEREVLGHRDPAGERRGAHAGRRRVRGHPRPRVPGEPVRPRLPVRARPPDRLRLPRRRREPAVQAAGRVLVRAGRGRGPGHQSDSPRVGRRPVRLPGPDERRGAGQQGRGPGLGPGDEEGDRRDGRRRRRPTPTCR